MKRFTVLSFLLLVVVLVCLASCGKEKTPHTVSIKHGESYYLLEAPTSAIAGDVVTIKTIVPEKGGIRIFANNTLAKQESREKDYWLYSFTMPDEDVVLDLIGSGNIIETPLEREVIEAHLAKEPKNRFISVEHLYCKFENGAIAVRLNYMANQAFSSETVAGKVFHYPTSNHIFVLYQGEFYSLIEAYENGYLTDNHIAELYDLHRDYMPSLYDTEE